jgi:cell division protein FtsB
MNDNGLLKSAEQLSNDNLALVRMTLQLTRERDTLEAENVKLVLEKAALNEEIKKLTGE